MELADNLDTTNTNTDDLVSYNDPVEKNPDDLISLKDEAVSVNLPRDVAEQRASKADSGLGPTLSPGVDVLARGIETGQEGELRRQSAVAKSLKQKQDHLDFLRKIVGLDPGAPQFRDNPLSQSAIEDYVVQASRVTDESPDTVWEKSYGNAYIKQAALSSPETNKVFKDAFESTPTEALQAMEWGANTVARKEKALTILQNLEAQWEDLPAFIPNKGSFLNKTDAQLSGFIPFLSWYRMHDAIKDAGPTESFLPGSNMEEQVKNAWLLPPDKFHIAVKNATDELWQKNPLDAIKLAQAIVAYGTSDQLLGDIFGGVEMASVVPIGWIGRGISGFLSKGSRKAADALKAGEALSGSETDKLTSEAVRAQEGPPGEALRQWMDNTLKQYPPKAEEGTVSLLKESSPKQDPVQLEMFSKGGDATQTELFDTTREQSAPTLESKLEPGKLRATYEPTNKLSEKAQGNIVRNAVTGKFERRRQEQLELNLPPSERQLSFDLAKKPPQELEGENLRVWAQRSLETANEVIPETTFKGMAPKEVKAALDKNEELLAKQEGTSFQTSKGSIYDLHADGTTTRNKSFHPEHGEADQGLQPRSQKTYYVTPEEAQKLGEFQTQGTKKSVTEINGKIGVKYLDGKDAGKFERRTVVTPKTSPEEGLVPVETWDDGTKVHFGNTITKVTKADARQALEKEIADQKEFLSQPINAFELTAARGAKVALTQQAVKGAVKSSEGRAVNLQDTLTQVGDLDQATAVGALRALQQKIHDMDPTRSSEPLQKMMASIFNPDVFWRDASAHSRDGASDLANKAISRSVELINALINPARVNRLTPEAEIKAIELAQNAARNEFGTINDSVLDVVNNGRSRVDNVNTVSVHIAKPDKTYFETPEQALYWARKEYKLQEGDFFVAQQGKGFYINVVRPVNETLDQVRDSLVETLNTPSDTGVMGWLKAYAGKFRSAEDTQSTHQRVQRHLATNPPQALKKMVQDQAEVISKELSRGEFKDLGRILEHNRDMPNPDMPGERGYFYKTSGELDKAYLALHRRLPSNAETNAYQAYTQLSDFDWALRELNWHRDKSRAGFMNFNFSFKNADGEAITTPWFQGRKVDGIDYKLIAEEGIWLQRSGKPGEFIFKNTLKGDKELKKEVEDKIKDNGYQVIELFNPLSRPLAGSVENKELIHYVITDSTATKRLRWGENSEYRPGGHVIYQQLWFIKQPIIATGTHGRPSYYGDATIRGGFSSQAEAAEWAKKYDTARQFLQRGDDAGLDAYLKANLPESLSEFKKLFSGAGPAGGLSVDHPIVPTFTGRNVFESNQGLKSMYGDELIEQATHPSNPASQMEKQFLADRNQILTKNANLGSEKNPIFKLVPATQLDPFTALEKGLSDVIRNRFLGDYKISASESLLNEFYAKGIFDSAKYPLDKIRRNPLFFLHDIKPMEGAVNREDVLNFETARTQVFNLLSVKSDLGREIEGAEMRLMNGLYDYTGSKVTDKATQLLPFIRDPASYMRAVAFHSALGFFNPVQLFVQSQSLATVLSISPVNGAKGFGAYMAFRRSMFTEDPATLNAIAGKMSAFGWSKDDFLEAREALMSTGFHHIAGETGWKDVLDEAKTFQGTTGRWLDKGTWFFSEGERSVRGTAFFTAYKDWKALNPTKEIDNHDLGTMLTRADLLSGNMTRASNAAWQKGLVTVPTQFMTYNLRQAEMFWGNRLTKPEVMRLMTGYSVLYGVPIALSAPTAFAPFYEDVRKEAMENGKNINDLGMRALHEGVMSLLMQAATGENYNIEQRYGPGANNSLTETFKGNKDFIDILGAGPATVRDIFKSVLPFTYYLRSEYSGTMMLEDLIDASKNIHTLSNGARMLYGLNTGKYVSKNDLYVGDVTTMDSVLGFVMGVTPQHITDTQLASASLKDQKELQDNRSKEIIKDLKRSLEAGYRGDYETMDAHRKRAEWNSIGAGLDFKQQSDNYRRATQGFESLEARVNRDFWMKAPTDQKLLRLQNKIGEQK